MARTRTGGNFRNGRPACATSLSQSSTSRVRSSTTRSKSGNVGFNTRRTSLLVPSGQSSMSQKSAAGAAGLHDPAHRTDNLRSGFDRHLAGPNQPGQPLGNYLNLADPSKDVDVHGHQCEQLARSKCFQASPEMTCSTCHDVHKPEPDPAALSPRCLACHKVEMTETHSQVGAALTNNCVDCHMPVLASKVVSLDIDGKQIPAKFRTHWIRIYSEEERK
jgi:hypothetical protein